MNQSFSSCPALSALSGIWIPMSNDPTQEISISLVSTANLTKSTSNSGIDGTVYGVPP